MRTNKDNTPVGKRIYYEPDEDFYRSIPADEFRKKLVESMVKIDKIYAERQRKNLPIGNNHTIAQYL